MKRISKNSDIDFKLSLVPKVYEESFTISFYTTNQELCYTRTLADVVDGIIKLPWAKLSLLGTGVLNYQCISHVPDEDYPDLIYDRITSSSTEYYIDTNIIISDSSGTVDLIGDIEDKLGELEEKDKVHDSSIEELDDKFDDYVTKEEFTDTEYVTAKAILEIKNSLGEYAKVNDTSNHVTDTSFNKLIDDINTTEQVIGTTLNIHNEKIENLDTKILNVSSNFDNYLPLSGGIMNGDIIINNGSNNLILSDNKIELIKNEYINKLGKYKNRINFVSSDGDVSNNVEFRIESGHYNGYSEISTGIVMGTNTFSNYAFLRVVSDNVNDYDMLLYNIPSGVEIIAGNKNRIYINAYTNTISDEFKQHDGIFFLNYTNAKQYTTDDLPTAQGGVKTIGTDIAPLQDGKVPTEYLNLDDYVTKQEFEDDEYVISKSILDLKDKITKVDTSLNDYIVDSSNYLTSNDISTFVTNASYKILNTSLSDLYIKSEDYLNLNDVSNLVTNTSFNELLATLNTLLDKINGETI